MVKNMVEEMENVAKDSKNKTDFNKRLGTLSTKQFCDARKALREGKDVRIISDNLTNKSNIDAEANTIKSEEIKAWGLDVEALIARETGTGYYAHQIL